MLLEICSSKSSKTHTFERENQKIFLGIAATPLKIPRSATDNVVRSQVVLFALLLMIVRRRSARRFPLYSHLR
jgi:hypothetical protein